MTRISEKGSLTNEFLFHELLKEMLQSKAKETKKVLNIIT